MARPGGLGKGLGALIPSGAPERGSVVTAPGLQELPIAAIRPNPYQPPGQYDLYLDFAGDLPDGMFSG